MGQALEQKNNVLQTVSRNRHCLSFSMAVLTFETQVSPASPSDRPQPEEEEKMVRRPKGEDIRHTVFRPQGVLLTKSGLGQGRANQ